MINDLDDLEFEYDSSEEEKIEPPVYTDRRARSPTGERVRSPMGNLFYLTLDSAQYCVDLPTEQVVPQVIQFLRKIHSKYPLELYALILFATFFRYRQSIIMKNYDNGTITKSEALNANLRIENMFEEDVMSVYGGDKKAVAKSLQNQLAQFIENDLTIDPLDSYVTQALFDLRMTTIIPLEKFQKVRILRNDYKLVPIIVNIINEYGQLSPEMSNQELIQLIPLVAKPMATYMAKYFCSLIPPEYGPIGSPRRKR
jgi:hypothetical protein